MSQQEPILEPGQALCEPVLMDLGILHGFAVEDPQIPEFTAFPVQVHGARWIAEERLVGSAGDASTREADAILASRAGTAVGIVTADCVPLLAASEDGGAVVAIHAGWRGLAAGVIEAGLEALGAAAPGQRLVIAVGPAARGCCYEVDAPVREALSVRHGELLAEALFEGRRPGHHQLDLAQLARQVAARAAGPGTRIGVSCMRCTICGGARFESVRRDGAAAGRMRHFIVPGAAAHAPG